MPYSRRCAELIKVLMSLECEYDTVDHFMIVFRNHGLQSLVNSIFPTSRMISWASGPGLQISLRLLENYTSRVSSCLHEPTSHVSKVPHDEFEFRIHAMRYFPGLGAFVHPRSPGTTPTTLE